ncbi:hypothetical protein [Pedobacter sp.]|uniref:hypothetical protein n=1 Tax=Pedobacter sp. TaxID=1411316 RepID=UPI0031E1AECB
MKSIYQIGGRPFNIEAEQHSIESLRVLRNHLMHFDPPSLVITLEEVTIWFNQIIDIGKVLIKMRQALGIEVSEILLNFVLQEEAIFIAPDSSARKPLQLDSGDGYQSLVWPKG